MRLYSFAQKGVIVVYMCVCVCVCVCVYVGGGGQLFKQLACVYCVHALGNNSRWNIIRKVAQDTLMGTINVHKEHCIFYSSHACM